MTALELNNGIANKEARDIVSAALEHLPDLAEADVTPTDMATAVTNLSIATNGAADTRITDIITTALTTAYNSIRSGLTTLNTTLNTEFAALGS